MNTSKWSGIIGVVLSLLSCTNSENKKDQSESTLIQEEVNVYSHRFYDTDKELFKLFEEKTGIKVNVKMDDADKLIQLIQTEGKNTPADILITTDIGRLFYAKKLGLLKAVNSEILNNSIPKHLRGPEGKWYGLTKRARVIMYNTELVAPEELSTYEDLATPKWGGAISVRSSSNIYNKSLLASIIAHNGEEASLDWANAVVANMATDPKGNDRDQMRNIVSGTGKIAIANTYYLGLLLNSENEAEKAAAQKIKPFFPNQEDRGTHINISGAGIISFSQNEENAVKLLEFLVSEEAQKRYAEQNFEYPVNQRAEASELLKSWGSFKEDTINLETIGALQTQAIETFKEASWN